MIDFEKRAFRCIIFGSLFFGVICGAIAFTITSSGWMSAAFAFFFLAIVFAFFWFVQACSDSMRDYGLGEGIANLYGEERAKMLFGENYKRPIAKDE